MVTFLDRYLAGEHEQVWAELQTFGDQVRQEPLYSDAWAVASETMRRAKHNLKLLSMRLQEIGYSFGDEWELAEARLTGSEVYYFAHRVPPTPVVVPPSPDVIAQLTELETLRGPVPISVKAWYHVVGSVNFTGLAPESWWRMGLNRNKIYEDMPPIEGERLDDGPTRLNERLVERKQHTYFLDPIHLWPLDDAISCAHRYDRLERDELGIANIAEWRENYIPKVPMGPDMHHKYNYSGGDPVGVNAQDQSMDGLFKTDYYQGSFVNFLRLCCRYAGLPGLRDLTAMQREWKLPAREVQIEHDVRALTEGLLPF